MVSFVSKIHPSPDWFVGVSKIDLCESSCSWVKKKEMDLYPYDAGTDNGPTYMVRNTYFVVSFFFCIS